MTAQRFESAFANRCLRAASRVAHGVKQTPPVSACGHTKRPRSRPFREQAESIAVPPEQFDQIAPPAAEHEHVAGEGILFEHGLGDRAQAREAAAHVGEAGSDPDAGARSAAGSSIEVLQQHAQACGIDRAFDPHSDSPAFDLNGARVSEGWFSIPGRLDNANRHQPPWTGRLHFEKAFAIELAPVKDLVRIHSVRSRNHGR